jgi:hypothetical protein
VQRGDIAPGFAADCIETLQEIAIRYASLYRSLEPRYIPALNGAGEPAAPSSLGLGARSAYLLRADAG